MSEHYYFGKVADEPNEWVLGTLEWEDDNYAYIFQQREDYPFSKCCGWGVFAVLKSSLRNAFLIEQEKKEMGLSMQLFGKKERELSVEEHKLYKSFKNSLYRLNNKEKIKQHYERNKEKRKQYYLENRDLILERIKKYREENKEKIKERNHGYWLSHKEERRAYNTEYVRKKRERQRLEKMFKE